MSFARDAVQDCMQHTRSLDGTQVAFTRTGHGPAIILVVGAFNDHSTSTPLAEVLAPRFSVVTYDRRGRGESGDTLPYAVTKEIEDLAALIDVCGGSAGVFGYSSGAMLALRAAAAGLRIGRLALYDAPYLVDAATRTEVDYAARLADLVDSGKRGEAVEYFQSEVVGIPPNIVAQLRQAPFRAALEAMAHTLVYEAMILGDGSLPCASVAARVGMPTLAVAGGAGAPIMPRAAEALAALLPDAHARVLPDQGHDLDPGALGPLLVDFFESRR
jgi:pimeloyl-ACP methyl ester carboxylesterase